MSRVAQVTSLDLRHSDEAWAFATARRDDIRRHWDALAAAKPALWNGTVLLCAAAAIERGQFSARFFTTDYASFVASRDFDAADTSVFNCFGVPVAFSSDGALLVGVMGAWTLNAGKAYPPSGSLEPRDVQPDGTVDLAGSMQRELREETGLDLTEAVAGEMIAVFDGPRIALARRFDFPFSFATMQERFAAHHAADSERELTSVEAVRSRSDIDSRMPVYAAEIIRHFID